MSAGRGGDTGGVPPRWAFRIGWALHRVIYALSGGRLGLRRASADRLGTLRLRTLGRRSGRERATMLYYVADGANLAVVASNAGDERAPAWWLNLQAEPEADVDLPDGPRGVRARPADAEEHARLWPRFVALLDQYAAYATSTERAIPVVILEPLPAGAVSSEPASAEQGGPSMVELLVDAVISDMDGVLVDTGGIYERHWQAWAARHGVDHARIVTLHFGRPAVETIRLVAPALDPEAEARRFNDELAADEAAGGVVALPGAMALLRSLPAGRWGVATSAPRVMARRWLASVELPEPSVLVSVDDVARGKPAPDPYLRAAELLGVDPGRCLVIEDAPAGISAAKAAGATVLAVRTTHAAVDLEEADHQVGDLTEVSVAAEGGAIRVRWG